MKTTLLAVSLSCFALSAGCKKAEPPAQQKPAAPGAAAPATPTPPPPAPAPTSQPSAPAPTAPPKQGAVPADRVKIVAGKKVELFGADVSAAPAVALASVLEKPEGFAGKPVVVTGKVRVACKKKGCWMELAPTMDKTTQGARVTFKSYGFFVPKDSAGADAKVEGLVFVKKVSKDEVEHMEAEGGRFAKKNADGSANEIRLVATGVELIH